MTSHNHWHGHKGQADSNNCFVAFVLIIEGPYTWHSAVFVKSHDSPITLNINYAL